ncbi:MULTISPECIES: winged helix-turn-helix domain-containing protein [Xanthomonas]|uniref:winged helix-turn-helix domain-containing protein n=1 Tax=Xanthomonas TaxID=338 RepID=UPI00198141E7|nr:helix-turn-helix domain-containing protein [Xanthomonas bonasiae]MBN6112225.1 helix-turn-helix transcriptional regulator [Xanthomonas bonasiae]
MKIPRKCFEKIPYNFNMTKNAKQPFDATAIRDPAHIRLLASPVRQELVDTLASLGGMATVAELSEQLGRPADGLYYHLQLLAEGGLVQEGEGAAGERVFRLAGTAGVPLRLSYDLASDEASAALAAYAKGLAQVAERDFQAALKQRNVEVDGPGRQLWAARNKGWLNQAELAEANALLERLCDLLSRPRDPSRDRPMSLAFVLAPAAVRGRRRAPKGGRG